jgi:hypothetical protein
MSDGEDTHYKKHESDSEISRIKILKSRCKLLGGDTHGKKRNDY